MNLTLDKANYLEYGVLLDSSLGLGHGMAMPLRSLESAIGRGMACRAP